jgi:hypothetical protein
MKEIIVITSGSKITLQVIINNIVQLKQNVNDYTTGIKIGQEFDPKPPIVFGELYN